jgi:hypothetical protein
MTRVGFGPTIFVWMKSGQGWVPVLEGVIALDGLTSEAFVGMWRERVAHFYSKYMATADAERAHQ